jgi:cytochrome c5
MGSTARWLTAAAIIATANPAAAQDTQQAPQPNSPARDPYQKSLHVYEFKKAAESGAERGREVFYYRCWYCHNEFTKDIPKLEGLFTRANLLSGVPVNEANVKDKVRNGGPGMPSYKYVLNDADLNDLTSYLREKCCWNSDSPPPNPRYIAR